MGWWNFRKRACRKYPPSPGRPGRFSRGWPDKAYGGSRLPKSTTPDCLLSPSARDSDVRACPEPGRVSNPIENRSAIGLVLANDGTRQADEIRLQPVRCCVHDRIAMAAHVNKRHVR